MGGKHLLDDAEKHRQTPIDLKQDVGIQMLNKLVKPLTGDRHCFIDHNLSSNAKPVFFVEVLDAVYRNRVKGRW